MRLALLRNVLAALLVGGVCGVGVVAVFQRARPREASAAILATSADEEPPLEPPADWCAPGFEPVGAGCLAVPTTMPAESLIVYLHGRYSRDVAGEEIDRQRRLGLRANARGIAVVAFRGRLGACTAPDLSSWYCWPSNETNADAGAGVVASWTQALATVQQRVGSHRRFVLGFSNGGYFAGLIASRGLLDADAIVVAHGGPVEPVTALRGTPPLLLLSADDDVAQDEMIRFDEELARAHWAHDSYARGGGHALPDQDIDAALAFFARLGEPLPLQPPLSLHRAVRHVRDAGAESETQSEETPIDDVTVTTAAAASDASSAAREGDDAPASAPEAPTFEGD